MKVEGYLRKGEEIKHKGKVSLAIPLISTIIAVVCSGLGVAFCFSDYTLVAGVILLLIGVPTLFFALSRWEYCGSSAIFITDKRVFIKVGLLKNLFSEVPLDKISGVTIHQPLFGKIFNYGTMIVESSAAVSGARIAYLKDPFAFKNLLEEDEDEAK